MSTTSPRGVARLFGVLTIALTLGALATPTASAATSSLQVTAATDGSQQLVGRSFPITLTITNSGSAAATGVTAYLKQVSGTRLGVDQWNGLGRPPGVTIEAGATRTFTVTASASNWKDSSPRVQFKLTVPGSFPPPPADLAVPMIDPTTTKGTASGTVFGDRDEDGAAGPGEGLAGVPVQLQGGGGTEWLKTVTDADGRWSFPDLPARQYSLYVNNLPDGWIIQHPESSVSVDGTAASTNIGVRAVRPLSDRLHVEGSFDKDGYEVGETANVKLTLSNSGQTPITGIYLACNRSGENGPNLQGVDQWAEFAHPGPGVTLQPGETKVFDETGTVPANSPQYGRVSLACDFGPDSAPIGNPEIFLNGKVAGPATDTWVRIFNDANDNHTLDDGEAISGTGVSLTELKDGAAVATATTDQTGRADFQSVPPGLYLLKVDGQWASQDGPAYVQTGTCPNCEGGQYLRFVPVP